MGRPRRAPSPSIDRSFRRRSWSSREKYGTRPDSITWLWKITSIQIGRWPDSFGYLSLFIMSKRIRIYSPEDLKNHATASSCWVSYKGKVYDISGFLTDHPGGEDILLRHAGQPVEDVMADKNEHVHSEAAYDMLDEFIVGKLGGEEHTCSEGTRTSRFV